MITSSPNPKHKLLIVFGKKPYYFKCLVDHKKVSYKYATHLLTFKYKEMLMTIQIIY